MLSAQKWKGDGICHSKKVSDTLIKTGTETFGRLQNPFNRISHLPG